MAMVCDRTLNILLLTSCQVFSLSVPEIGMLLSLGEKDSCEFFHDPFKGRRYSLTSHMEIIIPNIVIEFIFGL